MVAQLSEKDSSTFIGILTWVGEAAAEFAAVAISLLFILRVFDQNDVPFVGDIMDKRNNGDDDWIDPLAGDVAFGGGADTASF